MINDDLLKKMETIKTKEDQIKFLESIRNEGFESNKELLHKLKSVLFIIANTHITGDTRDPQYIQMHKLINMAGEAIIELESLGI